VASPVGLTAERPGGVRGAVERAVLPPDLEARQHLKLAVTRVLVFATLILGINYSIWRWTSSVNWSVWWIALPLVLSETYSLIDAFLFGATVWRMKLRGEPPPADPVASVDVFITTYNEPVDMVMTTASASLAMRHPHRTWVLDDGSRAEMRAAAEAMGVGYIQRGVEWSEMPRHAKAGNVNNALAATDGEFILILDADQIPDPALLERTLGYFEDPRLALVQTPQFFTNVGDADPLGSQAPLFYGPIQQGKDGWNAAFFCGSNAVLRRDALMQLGLVGYVDELEQRLKRTLRQAGRMLRRAKRKIPPGNPAMTAVLDDVLRAVAEARLELRRGEPFTEITYRFQRRVDAVSTSVVASDVAALRDDLREIAELGDLLDFAVDLDLADEVIEQLSARDWSPLGAVESVAAMVRALDVDRAGEAQAIMPLATISVTEDMATAMRLHAAGWRSVYHHEHLAFGLAPEDLGTMLHQRLRWAQGTIQVMLRENPLTKKGLTAGQRFMYFATMWSYLSGIAAIPYLAAPVLYLCFGVRPVTAYGESFLLHLVPYLLLNQALFFVVGYGVRTWRGQQYSLALFPIWIRAVTSAVGNVVFGRSLGFVVTPKVRPEWTPPWRLIRPQLVAMGLLAASMVIGLLRVAFADAPLQATMVNVVWCVFDLVVLSVIIDAALYRGYEETERTSV
jgi:cellulose synthase (UDP-forming)